MSQVLPQQAISLVVAEKPSVAKDLAQALGLHHRSLGAYMGDKLWITWCLGHVAELSEPDAYLKKWRQWRIDDLPMMPPSFTLQPARHAQEHWKRLGSLLRHRHVKELINACDAGREGELIFRFAVELAEVEKPTKRLWLSAMTETGIRHAFARLRPSQHFDDLAAAARCRAEADWLMGLNATRALTLAVRRREKSRELLTVGRVQTPTLAMLAAREDAIEQFEPENFYIIEASVAHPHGPFKANLHPDSPPQVTAHKSETKPTEVPRKRFPHHLFDPTVTDRLWVQAQQADGATVEQVVHKDEAEPPPFLHDLTSLQRRANSRMGLSAQATLDATQSLYEKHKAVTYPRTDSNFLPSQLESALPALLKKLSAGALGTFAEEALGVAAHNDGQLDLKRIVRDSEVSDHHAIIPTGILPRHRLSRVEEDIYDLILRRFLAAFLPPAVTAKTTLTLRLQGLRFVAYGRSKRQEGWHAVEPPILRDAKILPPLAQGERLAVTKVEKLKRQTEPPPPLTEASLLAQMERPQAGGRGSEAQLALKAAGLGTPATRAQIIENLKRRGFAGVHGRSLRISAQGRKLLTELQHTSLVSAELTGLWEAKLTQVASGKLARNSFMQDVGQLVAATTYAILKK